MTEQELIRNLTELAGFEYHDYQVYEHEHKVTRIEDPYWTNPRGQKIKAPPNFPQSLDACFKYLVPIVIDKIMAEQDCSSDVAYAILFQKWLQELQLIIPEAALALCLAIENLIKRP